MSHSMGIRSTLWVALNIAGMLVFLLLGRALWVRPGEEGEPGGPGDGFYLLFVLVPILVTYMAVDLAALAAIVCRLRKVGKFEPLLVWLAITALWFCAVAYDYHRSARHIDREYSIAFRLRGCA
jgi:hypothetical protein